MNRIPSSRSKTPKISSVGSPQAGQSGPTADEQGAIGKLYQQNRYLQAQQAAKELTEKYPMHPFGWLALGRVFLAMEKWDSALPVLEKAQQLSPQDPEVLAALGYAYLKRNETKRAMQFMEQALAIDGNCLLALIGLSRALFSTGKYEQVIRHCEHILTIEPRNVPALVLRAASLGRMTRIQDALHALREALAIAPGNCDLHNNIANLFLLTGEPAKAEEHYRKAWEIEPENDTAFSNFFVSMHYNPDYQASDFVSISREWDAYFRSKVKGERAKTSKVPNRRLRVGLISGGFRTHPVGQMITSALQNLPGADFELFAYATNDTSDAVTDRIRQAVHHWQLIEHLNHQALAERIRQDGIDILIDLNGPGEGSRYKTLAQEPAPIQIKWVGSLINTTGLSAFDYLLSDSIETPEGSDSLYGEKLIRMPDDYICYCPPDYTPAVGALPALSNGYITFGCLNNPAKLNRQLLSQWASLMQELPSSRLLLKGIQCEGGEFCDSIRSIMEAHGVTADRLILEGAALHQEFMATYSRIDIALDTWPYSGGLTTCEAMLMGVPVVTLPGPTFAGRHSATHLINAGMPELVTASWDEYRKRVIGLACDLPSLSVIRACLRTILLRSPVCDGPRFGRHLTTALRAIWQRHCEGQRPAALSLDKEGQAWFENEKQPVVVQRPPVDIAKKVGFDFGVQGKIIVLDNGGQLVGDTRFAELQKLDIFATLAFDPSGRLSDIQRLQQWGELHHYPQVVLGDGRPATLYLCQDPAMSATLEPLQAERQLPGNWQATQVIGGQRVATLRLDDIEGLESIDWLLLDNLNDSLKILENGEKALANTLLVQVRVNFVPTHEHQPELTQISHWLSRHGFSFYRLNNLQHSSYLPKRDDLVKSQATQLTCADALFIPNERRMAELTDNQRLKLAFVLHTVYGIQDLATILIGHVSAERSLSYLMAEGFLSAAKKAEVIYQEQRNNVVDNEPSLSLPEAPFMSDAERVLFKAAIEGAEHYFEFGSGGSTVWAVREGLTVKGVESDAKWVNALKSKLGKRCQVEAVDIGPTGEWGYPLSQAYCDKFPDYSCAIHKHKTPFDLILVDGRFRVACAISAVQHILSHQRYPQRALIFIHDFWNRPQYHVVLDFLDTVERVDNAGLFKIREGVDCMALESLWKEYAKQPA